MAASTDDVRHAVLLRITQLGAESSPGEDGLPPPAVREEMARLRATLDDDDALAEIAANAGTDDE